MQRPKMQRPLAGLRVLDFTTPIAGPYCARLLADLGAEVIKIEAPDGDMMRTRPPLRDGSSTSFGQLNAGKHSIALDLKQPEAVTITPVEREGTTVYELRMDPQDVGKIIGRQGMTINAIRSLLLAGSAKRGIRWKRCSCSCRNSRARRWRGWTRRCGC